MRKSHNIIIASLFQNNHILIIDIIAPQKPYKNTQDQIIYHQHKDAFHFVYSESDKTWVYFFVNKKIEESS